MNHENKEVLDKARKRNCELCGHKPPNHAHHLMSRGAGRVDIDENISSLCFACHSKVHSDVREANKLWDKVEKRTGLTKQEIQVKVWEMRRQ